jgi:hypothetical protein
MTSGNTLNFLGHRCRIGKRQTGITLADDALLSMLGRQIFGEHGDSTAHLLSKRKSIWSVCNSRHSQPFYPFSHCGEHQALGVVQIRLAGQSCLKTGNLPRKLIMIQVFLIKWAPSAEGQASDALSTHAQ